jgi:hypothetical protein
MRSCALCLLLHGFALNAHAARPFVTDDARIVDPGGYQIESFYKRQNRFGENEFWFLPAMNPGGRVELTLGGMRVDSTLPGDSHTVIAQAKTLLKPLETNGAGYALTLGVARTSPFQSPGALNPFLNAIGSVSMRDDAVVVHANLGAQRDRLADLTRGTFGVGGEFLLSPRFIAIAENYGQRGEKPTLHMGLRVWLAPNRVQIDATVGHQNSGPPRRDFRTIGLRILF